MHQKELRSFCIRIQNTDNSNFLWPLNGLVVFMHLQLWLVQDQEVYTTFSDDLIENQLCHTLTRTNCCLLGFDDVLWSKGLC